MKIKICGITNYEDAKLACDFGADALGFVFYEKSPRFIKPILAKEIIKKLPPFVVKVALFVNKTPEEINKEMEYINADIAQIHFEADEKFFEKLNYKYLKVVRVKNEKDIDKYQNEYRLVDAYVKEYGGSGKRINLDWFRDKEISKIILAGGLTPENIEEIKDYNFYGVDVSSGVEKYPGKKDKEKLKKFISTLK